MTRLAPIVWGTVLVAGTAHAAPAASVRVDLGNWASLDLILVNSGSFVQGSPAQERGRGEDETPRTVKIGTAFYVGKTPVTRGQFARFATATGFRTEAERGSSGGFGFDGKALVQRKEFTWRSPGFEQTDDHPVVLVTYDDALAFTRWASEISGRALSLPTEAQWEFAYRGGSTTAYYAQVGDGTALGWFRENAGNGTRPVGQKPANALGLVDMAGNAREWCLDWYAAHDAAGVVDPVTKEGDTDPPRRVLRGGSWFSAAKDGRAAARYRNTPGSRNADNGFRVAATIADPVVAKAPSPLLQTEEPDKKWIPDWLAPLAVLLTVVGGPILWVVLALRNRKRVIFRLGPDGFWIHASKACVGMVLRYRYHAVNHPSFEGQVVIERTDKGQYVYTGVSPTVVEQLTLLSAIAAGAAMARGASRDRNETSSSFRDYPSAY